MQGLGFALIMIVGWLGAGHAAPGNSIVPVASRDEATPCHGVGSIYVIYPDKFQAFYHAMLTAYSGRKDYPFRGETLAVYPVARFARIDPPVLMELTHPIGSN
jgi:hypothetical protein